MIVTLRDLDEKFVSNLKALTGERTASKAILVAAQMGVEFQLFYQDQCAELVTLKLELRDKQRLIDRISKLAGQIVEQAAQIDTGTGGDQG